jgi:hypothetical protein
MSDKDLRNLVTDFVTGMEKDHAGSYIESIVKAVRSWLSHNHRELKGKIKIRGTQETPSLRNERVPTREELRKIFLSADNKSRTASVLLAHSGLRLETLGNYRGNDGLRIQDFPEMFIEKGRVNLKKTPTLVKVRRKLSKARHQYFTFLSEEGCEYLRNYLEMRMNTGEELTTESAIVTPKQRIKSFIRTNNISDSIRAAVRKAGFPWRPYVLRSYFDTQLMLAESKGLVLRDYRQFWMGHKGDIENLYTTNKQKLPEEVIEDMRKSYRKSQKYLQTTITEISSEEKVREEFRKQLLIVAGFSEEDMETLKILEMDDKEFQKLIRQRLLRAMKNKT